MSPTLPSLTRRSSTADSASPVSSAVAGPFATASTTLASFSAASATGTAGLITRASSDPTRNASPPRTSTSTSVSRLTTFAASGPSSAPACTTTRSTSTVPSRAESPPIWSACWCVSTTASNRRTPWRASACLSEAAEGPQSTRTQERASRTRIESPWPTSRTMTSARREGLGASTTSTTPSAAVSISAFDAFVGGGGHVLQSAATDATATRASAAAFALASTAEPGIPASREATSAAPFPAAMASAISRSPGPCASGLSVTPARPAASETDISGPTAILATGEMSDTAWNTGSDTGNVDAWATSVTATASATGANIRGNPTRAHAAARRAKVTSPATDTTDSTKPTSKATEGTTISQPATAADSAASGSARRPEVSASATTTAIVNARNADGWNPLAATYAHSNRVVTAAPAPRPTRIRRSKTAHTPATTTRCPPLTATRCVSPHVLKSASADVPASRRRSPSTTPQTTPDPRCSRSASRFAAAARQRAT